MVIFNQDQEVMSSLLQILVAATKLLPLILKKLKEYKINKQEKILDEIDTSSDTSIIDAAKRLHESKKD